MLKSFPNERQLDMMEARRLSENDRSILYFDLYFNLNLIFV